MNKRLQLPMKTAFTGLSRTQTACHRRIGATMTGTSREKPIYAKSKKSFKSRMLQGINLSIPIFGNYCCGL
jgi:hypothetical protein